MFWRVRYPVDHVLAFTGTPLHAILGTGEAIGGLRYTSQLTYAVFRGCRNVHHTHWHISVLIHLPRPQPTYFSVSCWSRIRSCSKINDLVFVIEVEFSLGFGYTIRIVSCGPGDNPKLRRLIELNWCYKYYTRLSM